MIKEIYFGKVSKENWGKEDFIIFTNKKNKEKHYYYKITQETNDSDIHITDTCGRDTLVDSENLCNLIYALSVFRANIK